MKAKRFLILIPALIMAMLLSGCIQMVTSLDIKSDMSADIDIRMGILEDFYDQVGGESAFPETDPPEGFTVTPYTADGYKGFETKGTVDNILAEDSAAGISLGYGFLETGEEGGKKYIKFDMPASNMSGAVSGQTGMSVYELGEYGRTDIRMIVTLPYEIKESNATSVSGRTLTWDLSSFEGDRMYAYAVEGGFAFPIWLIIVIIAAAAAVVIVLLLLQKKKKAQALTGQYSAPQQPGQYAEYAQPETPVQPEAEQAVKIQFCPMCGKKLPESGMFCPGCGHKLK